MLRILKYSPLTGSCTNAVIQSCWVFLTRFTDMFVFTFKINSSRPPDPSPSLCLSVCLSLSLSHTHTQKEMVLQKPVAWFGDSLHFPKHKIAWVSQCLALARITLLFPTTVVEAKRTTQKYGKSDSSVTIRIYADWFSYILRLCPVPLSDLQSQTFFM